MIKENEDLELNSIEYNDNEMVSQNGKIQFRKI